MPRRTPRQAPELRLEIGITQQDLANVIGVTEGAIRKYENNSGKPRNNNLEQLAKDLALKLNAKIEIESKEELIITFKTKNPIYTGRLIQKNFNLIPQLKYQLNLDDFKLIIYEDLKYLRRKVIVQNTKNKKL